MNLVCYVKISLLQHHYKIIFSEKELSDEEIILLRAFALKTEDRLSDKTFDRLRFIFPNEQLPTFKATKARVRFLAAFKPVPYDCCVNSCCCFTGYLETEQSCPYCKEP